MDDILIKHSVNEAGKQKIKIIQRQFQSKSLNDGKDRKRRIVDKIIHKHKSLLLIANSYVTILPLFKSLVLVFQQTEQQLHKLHDMMVNNFRTLLASFMKFEVIMELSAKKLRKLNIEDNVRQPRTFFFGEKNEK